MQSLWNWSLILTYFKQNTFSFIRLSSRFKGTMSRDCRNLCFTSRCHAGASDEPTIVCSISVLIPRRVCCFWKKSPLNTVYIHGESDLAAPKCSMESCLSVAFCSSESNFFTIWTDSSRVKDILKTSPRCLIQQWVKTLCCTMPHLSAAIIWRLTATS